MEEGVVKNMLNGPMGELFDEQAYLTDVSGSGNNWAHGNCVYGPQYADDLREIVRSTAERCDSIQSFFLLHSMGGGTGSGLGTFILELLADEYPEVTRFTSAVFPSEDDDVITSPYNSVLATRKLIEFSDCVLPIENQALLDICKEIESPTKRRQSGSLMDSTSREAEKPFERMNNIAAQLLLHLTSSMRFDGSLNMDFNEITMNLVPYPRMHFLLSALSPLFTVADMNVPPARLNEMFASAFSPRTQLVRSEPKRGKYLACALLMRGDVELSDVRRNIDRMRNQLRFPRWNEEGWKVGLCDAPSLGQPRSLLCLANNTCISENFVAMRARFMQFYTRKTFVHHYDKFMDRGEFDASLEALNTLIGNYDDMDADSEQVSPPRRPVIAATS